MYSSFPAIRGIWPKQWIHNFRYRSSIIKKRKWEKLTPSRNHDKKEGIYHFLGITLPQHANKP